jgi:hypothetical protein
VIVTINCPPAGTVAAPKDRVALASKAGGSGDTSGGSGDTSGGSGDIPGASVASTVTVLSPPTVWSTKKSSLKNPSKSKEPPMSGTVTV